MPASMGAASRVVRSDEAGGAMCCLFQDFAFWIGVTFPDDR